MVTVAENTIGVDLTSVDTDPRFKTGSVVHGNDGYHYVYARANASISASTAVAALSLSSGVIVAAATGGTALSPATAMSSGEYAWFRTTTVLA